MINNIPVNLIAKRVAKLCYLLGAACLLVGLILSVVHFAGSSAAVNAQGQGNCDTGWVEKDEQAPFGYSGQEIITSVYVKSGEGCFLLTINNPSDGCYQAIGLGTNNVSVTQIGTPGPDCQEISHVEFYATQVDPSPTPTNTATNTATLIPTPTETATIVVTDPVVTLTPTDTPTPTNTATFTATHEATDPVVTLTPTDTPIPTATDPAATQTPTDPSPTNTPSQPETASSPTPPPTLPPPADTPELVLIPDTGVDLSFLDFDNRFLVVFFLGLGFLGVGLVFHGISKRRLP
ncbi:MAG: hypothetical protein JSV69_09840 [Chloroflexota bacterium]|nr:MAG: hypothetical protein JSV69_09840 [Chloroflexota bacterium]